MLYLFLFWIVFQYLNFVVKPAHNSSQTEKAIDNNPNLFTIIYKGVKIYDRLVYDIKMTLREQWEGSFDSQSYADFTVGASPPKSKTYVIIYLL